MVAVTALGPAAAFLFALSAFLQERAARTAVGADTASLRTVSDVKWLLGRLLRSRTWLTGWLANLCVGWAARRQHSRSARWPRPSR